MTVEERNKWLLDNMGFIYEVCQKYRFRRDYEDCIQTAFIGAIVALDRVREDAEEKEKRGFISRYIDGYVLNHCVKKDCIVHIPRYSYDQGVRLDVMSIEYEYENDETFESMFLPYNDPGYEESEIKTDLFNAIKGLSDKMIKTAAMLLEGYERKDIAQSDGCSRQAINLRVKAIQDAYRRNIA